MLLKKCWYTILFLTGSITTKNIQRKNCKTTENGSDYQGSTNYTQTGIPCQPWKATSSNLQKHPHNLSNHRNFLLKKYKIDIFELEANYCRNPGGFAKKPLCYLVFMGIWSNQIHIYTYLVENALSHNVFLKKYV